MWRRPLIAVIPWPSSFRNTVCQISYKCKKYHHVRQIKQISTENFDLTLVYTVSQLTLSMEASSFSQGGQERDRQTWSREPEGYRVEIEGNHPHRYCIPSRVLRIWHTGTAYPHRYWGYDSRVLRTWLTGTEDMTHRYCISSRVLRIWLTGTEHMTHG